MKTIVVCCLLCMFFLKPLPLARADFKEKKGRVMDNVKANKSDEGVPSNDRYFENLPDDVAPKKELFPGLYLIYHRLLHSDPVVSYKGLYDTVDKKKMEFTLERLADLYKKRKPWPLSDLMVQNTAEAISRGRILNDEKEIPSYIPKEKISGYHPFKIKRDKSKLVISWYSLWVSDVFPSQVQKGQQRPYTLEKYNVEFNTDEIKTTSEILSSAVDRKTIIIPK
jgi:hypothetical protein